MDQQITLGFLVLSYEHEPLYLTNIAKRSKIHRMKCVIFKPEDVELKLMKAKGKRFNSLTEAWEKASFPIPAFIYDRCFYGKSAEFDKAKKLVHQLKRCKDIHFLGHGLPDKWSLYCLLKKTPIKQYLPETYLVRNSEDIFNYVKKNRSCILKPCFGAGGTGIVALFYHNNRLILKYMIQNKQSVRTFFHEKNVRPFIQQLIEKNCYLIQPLLPLLNEHHEPFDIRILFQKSKYGSWALQGKGIRIGEKHTFVSNVAKGAKILSFNKWLNHKHVNIKQKILNEIKQIYQILLPILDQHFSPLFEIGLDIGFDQKQEKLWILDINSKPGRKLVLRTNPNQENNLYDAPLLYAQFLNLKLHKVGQYDL